MPTATGNIIHFWVVFFWKCSRPGWMGLWAAWSSGRCPCPWRWDQN